MAKTITKTGATPGQVKFTVAKFPIGITLAANEYPTGIMFHTGNPGPHYHNANPTAGGVAATFQFLLGDKDGSYKIPLYVISFGPTETDKTTPYKATFSGGENLRGKELYVFIVGEQIPRSQTVFTSACPVTLTCTADSYSVSTSPGTGGSLSASTGSAYPGDTVTVTASANQGYVLNDITSSDVTLSGSGNTRTFTMPYGNVTVSASFTRLSYSISTSAGAGGSLVASKSTAYPGETITVTANNNQGYSLTAISSQQVSLSGSGNTRTFTMPYGNVAVYAEFQRLAYSVSTGAGTGGSLAASASSVYPGNTVTLTAYPASGYVLNDITASGATLSGSGNTRTFVMPYNNVSAYATFTLIHTLVWSSSRSLSFSQNDNTVTVTLNGSATDNYGNTVTYNLYKNGSYVTALSGGKATVSLSAGELGTNITYKVVATAGGLSADGPSGSFRAVTHTLGWTNASLSGSQRGRQVTMTFGGYATDSWGKPISYYLYKENNYVGAFGGNSMTITLDVSELGVSKQYKVVAAAGGLTADGRTIAYTCASPTVTWDSGAQMYGQEIEENLVRVGVTRGAHIDNGYTGTVYYRVYIENVRENEDGDTRREWTLQPLQLGAAQTYKIDAYAVIEGMVISSSAFTMVITVEEKSRTIKYYDGQWHLVVMHYFDGTDFVEVEPYYYDGNEWILCSMT